MQGVRTRHSPQSAHFTSDFATTANMTCWQMFPQGVHITNRHFSSNAFQTAAFPSSCPPPSRHHAKQKRIQEVRRHAILFCLMFDVVGRYVAPPTNPEYKDRFSAHLTTSTISFEFLLPLNDASDATLGNSIDLRYLLTFFWWKKPSTFDYHCFIDVSVCTDRGTESKSKKIISSSYGISNLTSSDETPPFPLSELTGEFLSSPSSSAKRIFVPKALMGDITLKGGFLQHEHLVTFP